MKAVRTSFHVHSRRGVMLLVVILELLCMLISYLTRFPVLPSLNPSAAGIPFGHPLRGEGLECLLSPLHELAKWGGVGGGVKQPSVNTQLPTRRNGIEQLQISEWQKTGLPTAPTPLP